MLSQVKVTLFLKAWKVNSEGKTPIYLRMRYLNDEERVSTGIWVFPDKWNSKTKRVLGKDNEAISINEQLLAIEVSVRQIVTRSQIQGETITVAEIRALLSQKPKPKETFIAGFESFCKRMDTLIGKDFCTATVQRYRHSKERFEEFLIKERKVKDILMSNVDDGIMEDFEAFLKTTYNNDHTTIYKHYQRITKVLRFYLKRGAIERFPIVEYTIKPNKKPVEYLTPGEITKIEKKKIDIPRLEVIRDLYVFSIYSGLAYSEMFNLEEKHLILGMDGNPWINMTRQKTQKQYQVPLLPKAIAIIKKYKGKCSAGKVLPVPTNQKFNAYLKEIAIICGVRKELTVHLARKTFAITILLRNNISIPVVSAMLSHSDIKVTLDAYASVMPEMVIREMRGLKDKLKGKV